MCDENLVKSDWSLLWSSQVKMQEMRGGKIWIKGDSSCLCNVRSCLDKVHRFLCRYRNIIQIFRLTGEYRGMTTKSTNKIKSFIEIISEKQKILINLSEILYFEREARKICIVTPNAKYEFYDTLKSLVNRLPKNFVRCHTGYIVNMDYVVSIHSNYLVMKDEQKISIGRTYKGEISIK